MESGERATPDAIERKKRSISRLKAEDVPVNEHLPVVEGEFEAKRRSLEEVAYRAMALLVAASSADGLENPRLEQVIEEYGLAGHFTPDERSFLRKERPSEHERTRFIWRYEAACTLFWALGYIDALGKPTVPCDLDRAVSSMQQRTTEQFLADAKLRPLSNLLDEADLIYRYRWALVDARINGRPPPADLNPDVALERHHALNWLIGYSDQAWDELTLDT